jgi:hypothetical protein
MVTAVIGKPNDSLQITVVYRPPDTTAEGTNGLCDYIARSTAGATRSLIVGDFNLPHIDWLQSANTRTDNLHNTFQAATEEIGLTQCVRSPTCGNNILDLVLTSHPSELEYIDILPPIASSDHNVIIMGLVIKTAVIVKANNQVKPMINRLDIPAMSLFLSSVNWRNEFHGATEVDEYVDRFMEVISCAKKHCTYSINCRRKQFLPKRLRRLVLKKRALWKKVNKSNWQSWAHYKEKCKQVRSAVRAYRASVESNLISVPNKKRFFHYVSNALHNKAELTSLSCNGLQLIKDEEIADAFSTEFSKNFCDEDILLLNTSDEQIITESDVICGPNIIYEDVRRVLRTTSNSSAGPDGISGKLLRDLASVITLPLFIIFQQSLAHCVFPSAWKSATVIPIYKGKGARDSPSSYRPVSLCSVLGKTLEKLLRDQILSAATAVKPICSLQHGFTKKRSTTTNLLMTEKIINEALNSGSPVDVITVDFSRAFDKISHELLLRVLQKRGIPDRLIRWLRSYLSLRSQRVRFRVLSPPKAVTSGVIQGSSIGTTLFILYIDELLWSLETFALAFADDLKFVANLKTSSPVAVQKDLNRVYAWSEKMRMPISVAKSAVCHYGRNNPKHQYTIGTVTLSSVLSFNDLGVVRTSDNDFTQHIANIASKARKIIGVSMRSFKSRDQQFLVQLYMSYIRPIIMYAAQVWTPWQKQLKDELESIQRRFTKRLPEFRNIPYAQRLRKLNIRSLESARLESDLVLVYKILHNLVDVTPESVGLYLSNSSRTRSAGVKLQHLLPRSSAIAAKFMFRVPPIWNSLPSDIIASKSLSIFKSKLRKWLSDIDTNFID